MSITSAKLSTFNYKNMTMWAICLILLMNLFNCLVNENFAYAVGNNTLTRVPMKPIVSIANVIV